MGEGKTEGARVQEYLMNSYQPAWMLYGVRGLFDHLPPFASLKRAYAMSKARRPRALHKK